MTNPSNMAPGAEHDHRSGCDDQEQVDCPHCEGEGEFDYSECCTSEIKWTDICTECGEHCDRPECETCEGTGEVDLRQYKAIKAEEKED